MASTDVLLLAAVQAIKNKITATAGNATPEELAYLATSIDRIGGRATILEMMAAGDSKQADVLTAIDAARGTAIAAVQAAAAASINAASGLGVSPARLFFLVQR